MELKVNHGALDGASGDLASGAANIQSELDTMDAELQQLKANWEGDAQLAYQDAKARWTEGMNGMRQVLADISRMVTEANSTYRATDRHGAGRFAV